MSHRAVVMLSGGLDSSAALAAARPRCEPVLALTFDYGQRAAQREIRAARAVARWARVPHRTIRLPWLRDITSTALVDSSRLLPHKGGNRKTAAAVWVPNRNGVFLNICAAHAESIGADRVLVGFNREEAGTFPDNSEAFVRAANRAFSFSTSNRIKVAAPTARMDKKEIIELAHRKGLPLELTWSCYRGDERPCGKCESCRRRRQAERKR